MEALNASSYRRALELLAPEQGDRFLEIGFGTGRLVELLLAADPTIQVAGVDPTPTMLEVARNRRGVRSAGARVDLRLGGDVPLPWPERFFSAVAALHNFQFWPDPQRSIAEVRRVVKPGGHLVLVLRAHPRGAPAWLPNPLSRSDDEVSATIELLAANGFSNATKLPSVGSSPIIVGSSAA